MKSNVWRILLLALSAESLRAQVSRGVVLDSASHQPISGAVVTFFEADHRTLARAITSEAGNVVAPNKERPELAGVSFAPARRNRERVDINGAI